MLNVSKEGWGPPLVGKQQSYGEGIPVRVE